MPHLLRVLFRHFATAQFNFNYLVHIYNFDLMFISDVHNAI